MRVRALGIVSVFLGSLCCLVPLALIVLGLTTIGLSAFFVTYHWYFQGASIAIVGAAWFFFLRESRKARRLGTRVHREKSTRITLIAASLIVAFFFVFASYGVIARHVLPSGGEAVFGTDVDGSLVTISVKGMTCATCTFSIQQGLKKIDGVLIADASLARESVTVKYDPEQTTIQKMVDTINGIGYKAKMPE